MVHRRRPASSPQHLAAAALIALFLMGLHSTLFGPVKYAILPQQLTTGGTGRRQRPGRDGHVRRHPARHDPGRRADRAPSRRRGLGGVDGDRDCVPGLSAEPRGAACRRRRRRSSGSTGIRSPKPGAICSSCAPTARCSSRVLGISWFWFFGAMFLSQFPQLRQGRARRQRARGDAAARAVLDRHRPGLAAVRAAVRTQGRDRPRAVRLDRADACSPSICSSRARPRRRRKPSARSAFFDAAGALARGGRPGSDRQRSAASTSCRCTR